MNKMEFWPLFTVASVPVAEIMLVGTLGAFLASGYVNILSADARKHISKILFAVFGPALIFASLAKTVTLEEIISWWFMPVNIGITFLIGGILGRIIAKILRPEQYLEKIIIASCSAGNLGNLPLIIIPAICKDEGNPFGEPRTCNSHGLSYVSFSMALGGIFIWTHTYDLMRKSAQLYDKIQNESRISKITDEKSEESGKACFDIKEREASCSDQDALLSPSSKHFKNQIVPFLSRRKMRSSMSNTWGRFKEITGGTLHQIAEELLTPHAGTMAELFDVGQEECSVIFLWTYLTAALALTIWSTIFMWILT